MNEQVPDQLGNVFEFPDNLKLNAADARGILVEGKINRLLFYLFHGITTFTF